MMAHRIILIDDIDGSLEDVETHSFQVNDERWDIELSSRNLAKLKAALAQYISVARLITPPPSPPRRNRKPRTGPHTAEKRHVREWAESQGFEIKDRGQIPKSVLTAYERWHNPPIPNGASES